MKSTAPFVRYAFAQDVGENCHLSFTGVDGKAINIQIPITDAQKLLENLERCIPTQPQASNG